MKINTKERKNGNFDSKIHHLEALIQLLRLGFELTLVKNKAATNSQCDAAKGASNTNIFNFASNSLEHNKLQACTLILHVIIGNHKSTLCINYAFQTIEIF